MAPIILTSPMQGWAGSLDDVPDQVFAERMMGDGRDRPDRRLPARPL